MRGKKPTPLLFLATQFIQGKFSEEDFIIQFFRTRYLEDKERWNTPITEAQEQAEWDIYRACDYYDDRATEDNDYETTDMLNAKQFRERVGVILKSINLN
ncbi:hypothetical protein GVX76_08125 [[Haemophilus] felis]|nr:hypothetical protein [[Haemophilus] felis]